MPLRRYDITSTFLLARLNELFTLRANSERDPRDEVNRFHLVSGLRDYEGEFTLLTASFVLFLPYLIRLFADCRNGTWKRQRDLESLSSDFDSVISVKINGARWRCSSPSSILLR